MRTPYPQYALVRWYARQVSCISVLGQYARPPPCIALQRDTPSCRGEAGTKNEPWYFAPVQKKGSKSRSRFEPMIDFFFEGFVKKRSVSWRYRDLANLVHRGKQKSRYSFWLNGRSCGCIGTVDSGPNVPSPETKYKRSNIFIAVTSIALTLDHIGFWLWQLFVQSQ